MPSCARSFRLDVYVSAAGARDIQSDYHVFGDEGTGLEGAEESSPREYDTYHSLSAMAAATAGNFSALRNNHKQMKEQILHCVIHTTGPFFPVVIICQEKLPTSESYVSLVTLDKKRHGGGHIFLDHVLSSYNRDECLMNTPRSFRSSRTKSRYLLYAVYDMLSRSCLYSNGLISQQMKQEEDTLRCSPS